MKLYAMKERDAKGRPTEGVSLLAILETLAASAVAIAVALNLDTWIWLGVSALAAPILLMRSRESTAAGLRLARRVGELLAELARREHPDGVKKSGMREAIETATIMLVGGCAPVPIRIWATALTVARAFRASVAAIPHNWRCLAVSIDSTTPPQAIPGILPARYPQGALCLWDSLSFLRVMRRLLAVLDSRVGVAGKLGYCFGAALLSLSVIPAYLLAVAWRWSIKSSWWVYLPLMWISRPAGYRRDGLWDRIVAIRKDRLVLVLSAVVLLGVVAKVVAFNLGELDGPWWETPLGKLARAFVVPESLPVWQISSGINAILAFAVAWLCGEALRRRATDDAWSDDALDSGLRWATALRRVMTCYSIGVMLMILTKLSFPPVGPWLPV